MKRKIFSKLLMVALVIAAVGSFVSCKDYDDDINNLQKQIDNAALKSSVEALEKTLNDKIAAAQSAAQAAQTAADKAATTANAAVTKTQLDDAISAAKTAAATAANEYADKVATAAQTAAAKEAYDQAKAYVDAEVAKVTAAIPTEAAIKAIADASAAALDEKLATELKTWVNQQIDAIDVKGQVDAAVADAISKIDTATANVNAIWSAVTSIEFVYGAGQVRNYDLNFQYGTQLANVFGNKKEANAYAATDEPKTYVAGDSIKADNVYIVRVSPVTADLSTASLKLMNSKGEDLSDYVNIVAEKYDELLTRSGENGLWKITATLKDNFKIEALQKATHAVINKAGVQLSAAVYALAANNSEKASADRFAITAYDLLPNTGKYVPADELDFQVNGLWVNNYYNRWDSEKVVAEDGTIERDSTFRELKWKASADDNKTPAVAMNTVKPNYEVDAADARKANDRLAVKVGEPITISFDPDQFKQVDRYYVLLDIHNAVESDPSESNIWLKYDIDGLGVMKKSSEKLTITINDETAEGDIIGFRVYAVNYDGTLCDPDGKAFYVEVGDVEINEGKTIGATTAIEVTAKKPTTYAGAAGKAAFDALAANAASLTAVLKDQADKTHLYNFGLAAVDVPASTWNAGANVSFTNAGTLSFTGDGENNVVDGAKVTGFYWLMKNATTAASKWSEVNYIAVALGGVENWVDGTSITIPVENKGLDRDHHNKLVNYINGIKVTKKMPTISGNNSFSWKEGAGLKDGKITLYFTPDAGWNATATAGTVDLSTLVNNLDANTAFIFADADNAKNTTYNLPGETAATTRVIIDGTPEAAAAGHAIESAAWTLQIPFKASAANPAIADASKSYINGRKTSSLQVVYNWADISCDDDENAAATALAPADDYLANVGSAITATYSYQLAENTYEWVKYNYASSWTIGDATTNKWNANYSQSDAYQIQYATAYTAVTDFWFATNKHAAVPTGGTAVTAAAYTWSPNLGAAVPSSAAASLGALTMGGFNIANSTASDVSIDLGQLILAKNSKFSSLNNVALNNAMYVANAYDESAYVGGAGVTRTFKIRFNTKSTGEQEYFRLVNSPAASTSVKFMLVDPLPAVPTADVPSVLSIKAIDAFGQEKEIFAGDILLKK